MKRAPRDRRALYSRTSFARSSNGDRGIDGGEGRPGKRPGFAAAAAPGRILVCCREVNGIFLIGHFRTVRFGPRGGEPRPIARDTEPSPPAHARALSAEKELADAPGFPAPFVYPPLSPQRPPR